MPSDQKSTHLVGSVHPTVMAVVNDLLDFSARNGLALIRAWQGFNPGSKPEHSSGFAVDIGHNGTFGAGWSDEEGRRQIGILDNYIIEKYGPYLKWLLSQQRAWNPVRNGWRGMEDRGSVSGNHMDHAHLFFDSAKIGALSSMMGGGSTAVPETSTGAAPSRPERLDEDGILGDKTLNGLRWLVNVPEINRGLVYDSPLWHKLPTSVFETDLVFALQRMLGIKEDGLAWDKTIRALQDEFKKDYRVCIKSDGVWGEKTTTACQQYINWQTGNN